MALASRIDLIVVGVYMLLMLAVGVVLSYFNKTDSDFFKSGNKMPWWLSGLSLFMSMFSVWTFTGAAGLAYRAPGVAFTMYLTNCLVILFGVGFLAARWRRTRAVTIMSYLSERYGLSTNQVYSWTHLVTALVQAGIQLLALGKFVSVALGTDLRLTIIVCGLVVAIYCLIGGLWAVVVTDSLQFMVLFSCATVAMCLGLYEIGGVTALVAKVPEGFWRIRTQEFDWSYILAYAVVMAFAFNSGAPVQRYFSVKDEREARKVALLTMCLLLAAPALFFIPPICSRILGLDLNSITLGLEAPQEAAYVGFCLKYLPHGAVGIMLSAMLAATMSSLSTVFNAYAGVLTEDIIKQVFWKKASGKVLLLIGRLATLAFGGVVIIAALVWAGHKGGVFELMMNFSGVVIVPAGIPIVLGLFYRSTPWWAGLASFVSGLTIGVLYLLLGKEITFTQQVFFVGGISALIYFLPGFFIRPAGEYKKSLDRFYAKLATPISPEEIGDTRATDAGSYRITGWTTTGMGLAAMGLAFLDLPLQGRLLNLAIGGLIMLIGLLLLAAGRFSARGKHSRQAGQSQG